MLKQRNEVWNIVFDIDKILFLATFPSKYFSIYSSLIVYFFQ